MEWSVTNRPVVGGAQFIAGVGAEGRSVLNVTQGRTPDEAVLELSGEVDLAVAPGMLERLLSGSLFDARRIVVDLRKVTFIDSSGLGLLAALRKRALRNTDGEFAIVNARGITAKVLQVAGMAELVEGGLTADTEADSWVDA